MRVRELRALLANAAGDVIDDYTVTCSPGGGVLSGVTCTANGYVILDATPGTIGTDGRVDLPATGR